MLESGSEPTPEGTNLQVNVESEINSDSNPSRAIDVAHLNNSELVQRQARELELLHQIRSALISNFDSENALHYIVDTVATTFGYSMICLYLLEQNTLQLAAQQGYQNLKPEINIADSVFGQVLKSGTATLLTETTSESDNRDAKLDNHYQIVVPLIRTGNEIVGVLCVESTGVPLDEHDLRLCQAAADHLTLAIEQNRLYLSELRRADQLAALNKIGRELVSMLDVADICTHITGTVRKKLGYYSVNLGLVKENSLFFTVGVGENPLPIKYDFEVALSKDCLITYAYRHGELVLVQDVTQDERYKESELTPDTCAEIVIPLRETTNILGVLEVQSDRVYAFDDDEVILLKTLADQITIALSNAIRFEDIKQQKEELARANKALEEANRLKNELLANVSHELRTPLNSIMGYIDMIQSQFYGEVPSTFNDPLERVVRNSRRLHSMINDMLDLAKLEAGRETLMVEQFWLEEVIRFNCEPFNEQAQGKGLEFKCIVEKDCPKIVENDQKRLVQILTNLLANAIKFTHNGRITVEVAPAIAPSGGPGYSIKITDTGIGISSEDYESIFESFRQVDGSTTRTFGGAGMGLTICLKLIRMMLGSISVESELGKGSSFIVTLPSSVTTPTTLPVSRVFSD
ncbi:GAF domain-containing protein [Candidatus Chlorohelix sp.]|uniref:GAF domain-containing sensor histidine kinase n=1 Tax=Candidatus Chlorohelix sp. TaxID=3139201 RepID=UPI0030416DE0